MGGINGALYLPTIMKRVLIGLVFLQNLQKM